MAGSTVGSIALDRFCGNYLYLRIPNPLRRTNPPVEEVEIAARVLHRIDSIDSQPSFLRHIKPLYSMYVRYFPWLHVVPQGVGYSQFLNLESVDDVRNAAVEIVARLGMAETDQRRMPRSRDFPIGGREMIQKCIDAGMPD